MPSVLTQTIKVSVATSQNFGCGMKILLTNQSTQAGARLPALVSADSRRAATGPTLPLR